MMEGVGVGRGEVESKQSEVESVGIKFEQERLTLDDLGGWNCGSEFSSVSAVKGKTEGV